MAESTYSQFLPFLMQALGKSNPYVAAGTLGLGAIQTIGSLINRQKLMRQPRPQYTVSPELREAYTQSAEEAKYGYTPAQIANFQQQQARLLGANFLNATRMGGGSLAQAISGANIGAGLTASNAFASQDAALRMQKLATKYGLARAVQSQENLGTQQQVAYRMPAEYGVSKGLSSGLTNIASGVNAAMLGGFKNPFASLGKTKQPQYPSGGPAIDNMPPYEPIGGGGWG